MHLIIRLNSRGFVLAGGVLIAAGVVLAIALSSAWPVLCLVPGLQLMFRLVRDSARARVKQLSQSGELVLKQSYREIYSVAGRYFVAGPIADVTVNAIESLLEEQRRGVGRGPVVAAADRSDGVQIFSIDDIEAISFTSGQSVCRVRYGGTDVELKLSDESVRSAALDMLRHGREWEVQESSRDIFSFNFAAVVFCLPAVCLGVATILTSAGLMDKNQMPLLLMADVQRMKGGDKGRGWALLYAAACECYLFVTEQLPAIVGGLVGLATVSLFLWLLLSFQWKTLTDSTWTAAE
jgi:hypothetical protein